MVTKRKSHLVHVESLPADSIPITSYRKHQFTNLFYSPDNRKLYQQYKKRIREIETMDGELMLNKAYVRSSEGKTVYMSVRKLMQMVHDLKQAPAVTEATEAATEATA